MYRRNGWVKRVSGDSGFVWQTEQGTRGHKHFVIIVHFLLAARLGFGIVFGAAREQSEIHWLRPP